MTETDFSSATWRKSSHSGGNSGQCVEVAGLPHLIGIRDSKNPHRTPLTLGMRAFDSLLRGLDTA